MPNEWVVKAIPVVQDYLHETIGWPMCTNKEIMNELDGIWRKLNEENLIPKEITYGVFAQVANRKYMEAEINRIIGL